jgi:adenylate cyclase
MSSCVRIGDLTLDTGRRLLRRDAEIIRVGPLTYRLLLTLVEAAPNVVSHDELVQSIWAGRPVSPETISQRIKLLRDALSDDPNNPRYIEGVRGQGYRLLPRVLPEEPARPRTRRLMWAGMAAVSLVVVAAAVFWMVRTPLSAVQESSSIAVLPFVDLSPGRDQQYFADGTAEEILNLLSKNTTLRVIARTSSFSFRDKDADVRQIAEALGVTHVLEGSVRREGSRIRVTVRLVDASSGSRVWSESYDQQVGNILALQGDVAASVAEALKANLQNTVPDAPGRPVKAEAYDQYLRGQQQVLMWGQPEGVRYFEQAIAIDPEFIPAYYGLGLNYVLQVIDQGMTVAEGQGKLREILRRGLVLAPDDPGLLALSAQLARWDGEIQLAEERFARALQKDPANSTVRFLYATFKLDRSDPAEALRLIRRSVEIDPMNPLMYALTWAIHMDLGNAEQALAATAHYREIQKPTEVIGENMTARAKLLLSGDIAGSIVDGRKVVRISRDFSPPYRLGVAWLAMRHYDIGDPQTADALMEQARRMAGDRAELLIFEAYRHLVHGEVEEARRLATENLMNPKKTWGGQDTDVVTMRLAVDAMIENGEARRAVEFVEKLAPEYARYKVTKDIDARDFAPAPVPVKSAFCSFPARFFADYIRALRATGDEAGANQMLDHLEAILALRRERGLFIEERWAAEALALRGRTEAALDALEKAERDRTIYYRWDLVLLHNEIFAGLRNHPRFLALVERIRRDLSRQREELSRAEAVARD